MLINLSFKIFLRELKSGYLTSILVSLILAITIVSGISLFTDRLEKALNTETEEFLGGNLKLIGKKINPAVRAFVVPGSGLVKKQAEEEGLDKIFLASGFEWRDPGCSMCLAMNSDKLEPNERCASTSNRNFEGRQGRGGRTHLVSPGMAVSSNA